MKNWIKAGFKRSQMLIINGEELIANPAKVILQAQDFMGLQPLIKEDNFIFDKEKGKSYIFSRMQLFFLLQYKGPTRVHTHSRSPHAIL